MTTPLYKHHDAVALSRQITRWRAMGAPYTRFIRPGSEGGLSLALPESPEAFNPNMPEVDALLKSLKVNVKALMAEIGMNYGVWQTTKTRHRRLMDDLRLREKEIHQKKRLYDLPELQEQLNKALSPVPDILDYPRWLQILRVVGFLNAGTGKDYELEDPDLDARWRVMLLASEHLDGAAPKVQEDAEVADEYYTAPCTRPFKSDPLALLHKPCRENDRVANLIPVRMVTGAVNVEEKSWNAVMDAEPTGPNEIMQLLEGQQNAVLVGHNIQGVIRVPMRGVMFVNCMFTNVSIEGPADGATFIGCDFGGDCAIRNVKGQNNLTFHSCTTPDEPLRMSALTLTGIRFINCEGMAIKVSRAGMANSQFINGWVSAGRLEEDRMKYDEAPRVAPRSLSETVWRNGGLDFDMQHVPEAEGKKEFITAVVGQIISPHVQCGYVLAEDQQLQHGNGALTVGAYLRDGVDSTRELVAKEWNVTLENVAPLAADQNVRKMPDNMPRRPRQRIAVLPGNDTDHEMNNDD